MKPWRVTGILLLLTCLTLVAVPPLRRVLLIVAGSQNALQARQSVYEAIALQTPDDPQIWLGYAGIAQHFEWLRALSREWKGTPVDVRASAYCWPPAKTTPRQAYLRAIELAPSSPAPRFRYALYLLSSSGDMNRPDEYPGLPQPEPLPVRTAEESANLEAARDVLVTCRTLASDNAACDYLLAYVYFAQRMDAEARAAARTGAGKPNWSAYQREATLASWQVFDRLSTAALARAGIAVGTDLSRMGHTRSVARMLSSLGNDYRARGQHSEAIACYEAIFRLGRLMRVNAYTLIDGLVAIAVTKIAAPTSLIPAADLKAARAITDADARVKRQDELRTNAFVTYLRQHGRPDLADFYQRDSAEATLWYQRCKIATKRDTAALYDTYFGPGIAVSFAVWVQTALFAVLTLIIGLAALTTRCWRRPIAGFQPTYHGWLALLLILVVPGVLFGLLFALSRLPIQHYWEKAACVIPLASVLGLAAWLIGVGHISRRRRATLPADGRPGKAQGFFASLRSLVPPTLSALLLLSAIGLWSLAGAEGRFNTMSRSIAEQGEVRYWGVDGEPANDAQTGHQGSAQLPDRKP
ncbi:MAG: hypothetical protein ACM3VW_09405 [Bacteroidota bacterium]